MALPIEIRRQAWVLLKQGLRAKAISKRLGIGRSTARNWQHRYDRGDDSWVSHTNETTDIKIALQAVSLYTKLGSFSAVATALGLHSRSVRTYVANMAVYGVPILPQGRHNAAREELVKNLPLPRVKLPRVKSGQKTIMPKNLNKAQQVIAEQRIMLDCLLASIDKHLGGHEGAKKDLVVDEAQGSTWPRDIRYPILPPCPYRQKHLLSSF